MKLHLDVLVLRDIDPNYVTKQYEKVLNQLQNGDFASADVKKLQNFDIYRAKLDEKNRLLFKIAKCGDKFYLLILEVVRNHDYGKARFLNGGSYTDQDFVPLNSNNSSILPFSDVSHPSENFKFINPKSPVFHLLDKPLSFDDAQTEIFETPLPLIVIGPAGSGKTALTLEKLKTIPGYGLYLTRSSYLVENARSLYFANNYGNEGQEIDFLSLSELLQTIDVPKGQEATYKDFAAWYNRVKGTFRLKEPHKIYEEIKGVITGAAVDGPALSEGAYLAMGVRQSIFLGDDRLTVYRIFQRWLQFIKESGLYDSNVAASERINSAQPTYDFLVIDEVQDITNVELRLALATLKEKRHFLLCGDSNQIVHPNLFSWSKVKSLFYGNATVGSALDQVHILKANYRNTVAVTALANRLLLIKQSRFGSIDRESNYLVQSVSETLGRVDLLTDSPEVRQEIDHKTRLSTRYAIVVLRDDDKVFARQAFSTPLVFSVHEAKGLEYENVILFNLVSSAAAEFKECVQGVTLEDVESNITYARGRDKTNKSLDAYKFYINALYVAMTRAIKSLMFIEQNVSHELWKLLAVDHINESVQLTEDNSSREEWQKEARRLELQGKTEQAEHIRREILETAVVPWLVITPENLDDIKAKAIGPGPYDKASQQLLFEYALNYKQEALLPQLELAKFRHAKKPESGRAHMENTHYADYKLKKPVQLPSLIRKYGIDFRNPLNETPLMIAAKFISANVVHELLDQGADTELVDTGGFNPLRILLDSWHNRPGYKKAAFEQIYHTLATQPLKVKTDGRMCKLDPHCMEWFLLNCMMVQYRHLLPKALSKNEMPSFRAPQLEENLASFPNSILPERRKQRAYISSLLSKNEVNSTNPYNKKLFCRTSRGQYIINPALEMDIKGSWMPINLLMGIHDFKKHPPLAL